MGQPYVRNSLWQGGGHAARLLVGLAVSIVLARVLGPEGFGTLNYSIALIALVSVFAGLGLERVVKRELLERPRDGNLVIGTALYLSAAAAAIATAVSIVLALTLDFAPGGTLLTVVLGAGILARPLDLFKYWFEIRLAGRELFGTHLTASLCSAAAKISCVLLGLPLAALGLAFVVEPALAGGLLFKGFRKTQGRDFKPVFDARLGRRLLSLSWPLLVSGFAVATYMKIDQVMLGMMVDDRAVGQYSAAVRVSSILYFVPVVLATSLLPAVHKARTLSEGKYRLRVQQYFDLSAAVAYLLAIPLVLAAPLLITTAYGADYLESGAMLRIHAWSSLFVFLGVARTQVLTVEGHFRFLLFSTLSGAATNIILNVLLIPAHGGRGAAVATLLSYAASAWLSGFAWRPTGRLALAQSRALLVPFRPGPLLAAINTARSE